MGFRHKFACAKKIVHTWPRMPPSCREFCDIQELTCNFKHTSRFGSASSKVKTCNPSFSVPEQSEVCGIEFILFKIKTHEIPHIGNEYLFSLMNGAVNTDACHSANFFIETNYIFTLFRLN